MPQKMRGATPVALIEYSYAAEPRVELIRSVKWMNKLFGGLVGALLLCQSCAAAQLSLTFRDSSGTALADVVAALVPKQPQRDDPPARAEMDQRNYRFVPKVIAIRTNTLVYFPNSDDVRHHVYSFSPAKKFELRLYHGKTAKPVLFDQPGKVVLGCNIHDSMVGYIYVVDTPYFAVSDSSGRVQITDVPAGDYELQVYFYRNKQEVSSQQLQLTSTQTWVNTMTFDQLDSLNQDSSDDEFADLFQ